MKQSQQKVHNHPAVKTFIALAFVITWMVLSLKYPFVMLLGFAILAGVIAKLIIYFNMQVLLIKLIAFTLPFSVELNLYAGSMINVPAEPLLLISLVILFLEYLRSPQLSLVEPLSREYLWIVPLILIFILSIPFSQILLVSVKFSFINILYILVFFVYLSGILKKKPGLFHELILLYTTGVIVVIAWALYRYWQWEWNPVVVRGIFQPFYNDHTIFGASLAILAVYWGTVSASVPGIARRIPHLLLAIVMIAGLMLSTSRAAFLSLFFSGAVFIMLKLNFRFKHLAGVAGVVIVFALVFQNPIKTRLQKIEPVSYDTHAGLGERTLSAGNISTDVSNVERLNRWISAWRMFKEKPFTGFGPGTYQFTYIPYQEPRLMNRLTVTDPYNPPDGSGGTAHSEYLLALSELGIAGLLAWLLFMGRWTYIAFGKISDPKKRIYIHTAFAALSTYFFHAFFNNFLSTDQFAFLFWGTAAWLITNHHNRHEELLPTD
jgi:putative inorganic carbon (hco3(-)) transporter